MNDFITLARVVKTQGRRGEVAVEVHSDVPDRLHAGLRVSALAEDNSRRELQIEEAWPNIPVLLATGYAELAEGALAGRPRLSKPYRQEDLAAEIVRLLERGSSSNVISIGAARCA